MSSRPTSRRPSADPHRPGSRASFEGGLRSSVSRGFFDDGFSGGWPSSPVVARTQRATFSQMEREMVEKDSAQFYEYVTFLGREADGRFVGQFLGDAEVESVTFQEMFPIETSARQVLANALFNTCCEYRCGMC
jgi:hypothetical protein